MKIKALVLFVLLVGCSTTTSVVVTGESLKGIGNQFVLVAGLYKQGCDMDKTIVPSQCEKFAAFGRQFQKAFPLSVQAWEIARSANDTASQEQLDKLISQLANDLSGFSVAVIKTYSGGK